ncbi:MAG: NADP-dependent oxidoreductase [Hyphomonadaceae bacterium]
MSEIVSREIRLKSRPVGAPGLDAFELATAAITGPGAGEVLVRNAWMSVDPYMRFQMMEQQHYPTWEIGKVLNGGALGRVIESNTPEFKAGDYVESSYGWREYFVAPPGALSKIDPALAPLRSYLGAVGMPGLSAYVGLLRTAGLKQGERVFVSGAAGAVGSVACQIAKAMDCEVVATAGSDEKCDWLKEAAKVDHAINYKTCGKLKAAVRAAMPKGINVFFDNVGGDCLVAGIANMADFGRIAICGTISQYNNTSRAVGPHNLNLVVPKRIRLEGFEIADHWDARPEFLADMGRWIRAGKMQCLETVHEGLEHAPQAFIDLFDGGNLGKMLVQIGPE